MMLSAACTMPQVGLRTLNPHVAAAITAADAAGNAGPMLPRQHASMPMEGQGKYAAVAGISSFAFQVRDGTAAAGCAAGHCLKRICKRHFWSAVFILMPIAL